MGADTGADRLGRFLNNEEAGGVGGDDTPVYDAAGYDLTYGDLREVLRERDTFKARLDSLETAPGNADAETQPCEHAGTVFGVLTKLHMRIHRDFNFDASESAAPDDERWARVMDDLVTFADELYLPLADAPREPDLQARLDDALQAYRKLWAIMDELHVRVLPIAGLVGIPIDTALMRQIGQPREERHFSPGYEGEKPDHQGPENTCAMPACVKRRSQHEAAAEIQDLTTQMLADTPRAFPEPDWLIFNHERGMWWKPFERGYTSDLADAGRYLHPRAYQICREANHYDNQWRDGVPPEVMIPYTDDQQTAIAAVRKATQEWVADRAARTHTTGN